MPVAGQRVGGVVAPGGQCIQIIRQLGEFVPVGSLICPCISPCTSRRSALLRVALSNLAFLMSGDSMPNLIGILLKWTLERSAPLRSAL